MSPANITFLVILVLATGFFAYNIQRLVRYMVTVGRPDDRSDNLAIRFRNLVWIGLFQSKILRDPLAGAMHALVFWGFIVLGAGSLELLISGVSPGFSYGNYLPGPVFALYTLSQELFALFVLGAVTVLLYRRLVSKPRRLQGDNVHSGDAVFILSMIAVLMVTLFGTFGAELVLHPEARGLARPLATGLSLGMEGMSRSAVTTVFNVNAWTHNVVLLFFLNYLPYSKHLHVIASLPNVFLSNTDGPGQKGTMRPMDLEAEDAEQFGAADVTHLSWKSLLDSYSCTECGRCTAACPANITGKPLSPRKIMIDTRQRLMELAPVLAGDPEEVLTPAALASAGAVTGTAEHSIGGVLENRLLDNYITEDELWACTSCRACVQECPVSIDQLDIINEMRRNLVLMESRFPAEVQPAFENMERVGSPWNFSPADRAEWAEGLEILTMAEMFERGERPEVLFWVGCMGSFDDRMKKIAVAFSKIMKAAGIEFAILGQEESCNGDPARRLGNEYLYQILARQNIETLDRYEVKTVVTTCPHCFHQIGNEYPQLGGNYEVIHHATYIERLLDEGRIPLDTDEDGHHPTFTYHDSCYLGRYNNVYDAPRNTLRKALPVVEVFEPQRTRDRGLCCGAGGGRMFMEENVGKRVNLERTEELLATGAESIAAACPFCITMITDGVSQANSQVPVFDIAEVVAGRITASRDTV